MKSVPDSQNYMRCQAFDLKVIAAIKAIRLLRREKQANLASVLAIDQSEYCRIEKGERTLTIGQLEKLCLYLETSLIQIVAIAEAQQKLDFNIVPLSEILINFVSTMESHPIELCYQSSELEFIFQKIKDHIQSK